MIKLTNLHCQELSFDPKLSAIRLKNAQSIFPIEILFNILCLCLYLLGMKRSMIGLIFDLSPNTVRTKIRRFLRDGPSALFDRRKKKMAPPIKEKLEKSLKKKAIIEKTSEEIVLRVDDLSITISKNSPLQTRTIILTLVQNKLINKTEAAKILNFSSAHVGYLCNELKDRDIHSLLDQRKGHKEDYKFTPEVKAELIQIFTINSLTGKSTSGKSIAGELGAMFESSFSERSVRLHMSKLGLSRIKNTLPVQYELRKKKLLEIVNNETTFIQSGEICFHKISRMERRIEIVSLIKDGVPTKVICTYTGCHVTTVMRWKNRDEIADLARNGRPPIYKEEQQLRLTGFYCQVLPAWGGRWSLRTAEKHLSIEPSDIGSLSKSTIGRILSSHDLKPHRSRYFLNITDPDFFPKMELLIKLFLNRPKNLYGVDESPGIQVLQRLVPDLRTEETKKRLEEFEYIRNGTLDLFLCLDINSGKINCEIHSNHVTEKFVSFMENHFKSVSHCEPLHYVLDNLNTHCSYEICRLVAEYSQVTCPSEKELNNMVKRREWLSCNEKRIIFHYTPFHGSWLNPAEIGIGTVSAKCFKESYSSFDGLHDAIMGYVNFRNRHMAYPFRWKYDGKGLHEKVIKRLTQQIRGSEANTVELRIMTKQFLLAKNLLYNYSEKISDKYWDMFKIEFLSKEEEFRQKINVEEGPKRQEKAQSALDELKKALVDKLS